MNKVFTILKIAAVGAICTLVRIIGQLFIPATPAILPPSGIALNGMVPVAFTIYAFFVYSFIAAIYLLISPNLSGSRFIKGLKYGACCAAIWVMYLLEPLPHVALLDKFTYPLADGLTLIIMGFFIGLFLSKDSPKLDTGFDVRFATGDLVVITLFFTAGRMIEYFVTGIYSSFETQKAETVIWTILTGIVISFVVLWFEHYIRTTNKFVSAVLAGGTFFGVNYTLFNFFMPIIFSCGIGDLIIRTAIDIVAVTLGLTAIKFTCFRQR